MPSTHKYFHDKIILLMLSANYFLGFFSIAIILLRLNNGHAANYLVQYRSNLGIGGFKTGSVSSLLSFIVFAGLVLAVHTALSLKTYHIKRELAITILGFGTLLLVLDIIVSNALLALR